MNNETAACNKVNNSKRKSFMSRLWNYKLKSKKVHSHMSIPFVVYMDTIFLVSYLRPSILHLRCIIQTAASWILANVFISPWHWTQSEVLTC